MQVKDGRIIGDSFSIPLSPEDLKDKVLIAIIKALILNNNEPMSPREIAAAITKHQLTSLGGATPFATVSSRISQHFKRSNRPVLGKTAVGNQSRKMLYYIQTEIDSDTSVTDDELIDVIGEEDHMYLDHPIYEPVPQRLLSPEFTPIYPNSPTHFQLDEVNDVMSVDEVDQLLGEIPRPHSTPPSFKRTKPRKKVSKKPVKKLTRPASAKPFEKSKPIKIKSDGHPYFDFDSVSSENESSFDQNEFLKELWSPLLRYKRYTHLDKNLNIWLIDYQGVYFYVTTIKSNPSIPILRRVDDGIVNASALLYAAGVVSEQEQTIALSLERRFTKKKKTALYGTWIPLYRARGLADSCCLPLNDFLSEQLCIEMFEIHSNSDLLAKAVSNPKTAQLLSSIGKNKHPLAFLMAFIQMLKQKKSAPPPSPPPPPPQIIPQTPVNKGLNQTIYSPDIKWIDTPTPVETRMIDVSLSESSLSDISDEWSEDEKKEEEDIEIDIMGL